MPSFLMHTGDADQGWLVLDEPERVIRADEAGQIRDALAEADRAGRQGRWIAGFLTYEAAAAFDYAVHPHPAGGLPLLWLGVFEPSAVRRVEHIPPGGQWEAGEWLSLTPRPVYEEAIKRIRTYIADGHTYQVNYTMRLNAPFRGDPFGLFAALQRTQQSNCAAWVDTGRWAVCSASPELFFERRGEAIHSRPMKGTAPRAVTLTHDREAARALAVSAKDRAENVMIVDMVRNDLGRIARTGSVCVPHLYEVERYPTLWQMTSTVSARLEPDAGLAQIMEALFPCASITGAPKHRTMQIIRELEPGPRGIYTGAIGVVAPGGDARFNVAIRTVAVDTETGQAEYGVGGGVVWDSTVTGEYEECHVKARVLTRPRPEFDLLETLRWSPRAGWTLLEGHLERMAESAEYFNFPWDDVLARRTLEGGCGAWQGPMRVRLLLDHRGAMKLEAQPAGAWSEAEPAANGDAIGSTACVPVALAGEPIDPTDPFLYHKTTHRSTYERARQLACRECDDVLLWNPARELTEATMANVAIRRGDQLVTPPVACGLLPGVLRSHLLARGRLHEEVIPLEVLRDPSCEVWLLNSVRGLRRARLVKPLRRPREIPGGAL